MTHVDRTPRLVLRPFVENDLNQLELILGDSVVMEFSDHGPLDAAEQLEWLKRMTDSAHVLLVRAVERTSNNALIGYISLANDPQRVSRNDAELGFRFARAFWGSGYAFEAAKAMIDLATSRPEIKRLVAFVDPHNKRSVRVLEKLGMVWDGDVMFDGYDYPDHRFVLHLT
ncbi:MAG: GNAT family N-acetyltransferase [Pseudomonadota bacterium]